MQMFSWWSDFNSSEFYKLFLKCAQPRRWKAFDGKITEMDTQNSLRGKELLEIYQSISTKDLPKDERTSVLLTLKRTVEVRFSFLFMFAWSCTFQRCCYLIMLPHKQCCCWKTSAMIASWQLENLMYYLVCECNLHSR